MKVLKIVSLTLITATCVLPWAAQAANEWYMSATASIAPGSYSGSVERNALLSAGVVLNADYLEDVSIAFSFNNATIDFVPAGGADPDINQNAIAGRVQYHAYSDWFNGKVTSQLTVHTISNDDATGATDGVTVIAPKIAYMNYRNDLYMSLEWVNSDYSKNGNLAVSQITPSIGFSFNNTADWLTIRMDFISSNDSTLTQGDDSYASATATWIHWLQPNAVLGINNVSLGLLVGERIFAVDNDAFAVYNLADVQTGALTLSAGWQFGSEYTLVSMLGIGNYENKTINNSYKQQYLYFGLTRYW